MSERPARGRVGSACRAQRKPLALRPGGTVGVCAPAGPIAEELLEQRLAALEARGLRARCAAHVRARSGYLAGSDDERMADLLELLRDPEVDAILAARGGYGVSRYLSRLDPGEFARARKLVIGYSDTTSLALWLLRCAGLASMHGPMLERDDHSESAWQRWLALALGDPAGQLPLSGSALAPGRAEAPLVGGNLRMIAASLGTPWEIRPAGALLFFEEVGEQPYALDRTLVQLREAGALDGLAGVAIGQLVDCNSERYPETGALDVIREVLLPAVDGPVVGGLPFGHVADHHALAQGVMARIDGDEGTLTLLESLVEVEA